MDCRQGTRGETTLGKCEQRSRTREHRAAQKAKHRDRRPNQHEGAPSGSNHRRSRFRQWGNAVAGQGVTQKSLRNNLNRNVEHNHSRDRQGHGPWYRSRWVVHLATWLKRAFDTKKREYQNAGSAHDRQ